VGSPFLVQTIGPANTGVFVACLGAAMVIPSIPLQMVLRNKRLRRWPRIVNVS